MYWSSNEALDIGHVGNAGHRQTEERQQAMNSALTFVLILKLLTLNNSAIAAELPELKPFPAAEDGMERFVIVLPHKERGEEDDFAVEIIVGREMLVDGVNQVRLGNAIESRNLEGWGYTYYEVTGSSETISTLMAPPEGAPKVKAFVTAAPLQVRYTSRLPIVVYAPSGYEIRYRIWRASEKTHAAEAH
jgi:ecotin